VPRLDYNATLSALQAMLGSTVSAVITRGNDDAHIATILGVLRNAEPSQVADAATMRLRGHPTSLVWEIGAPATRSEPAHGGGSFSLGPDDFDHALWGVPLAPPLRPLHIYRTDGLEIAVMVYWPAAVD
jgi:hypothetical protein